MADVILAVTPSSTGVEMEYFFEEGGEFSMGIFTFDCTVSISYGLETPFTEHPIEFGAPISDHKTERPLTIDLTNVLSATPLDASLERPAKLSGQLEELHRLQRAGASFTLYLPDGSHDDMVIERSSWSRSGTYDEAAVSLGLKQIRTVSSFLTGIPPELVKPPIAELTDVADPEDDLGMQSLEDASTEEAAAAVEVTDKSALADLTDSMSEQLGDTLADFGIGG